MTQTLVHKKKKKKKNTQAHTYSKNSFLLNDPQNGGVSLHQTFKVCETADKRWNVTLLIIYLVCLYKLNQQKL